jgi:large subunit ribosomal protein L24
MPVRVAKKRPRLTLKQRKIIKRAGFAPGRKMRPNLTVKQGDTVQVITGAYKGKQGKIIQVLPRENRVIVENVNLVTRHQRRRPGVLQSESIEKPAPIHRSNVMLVCPNCGRPTRIAHVTLPNGKRVRACKRCHEIVDKG